MNITTLFDKSFLQSLSLNESVWFDHFFLTNICPLFYVETLADLAKKTKSHTSDTQVRKIADKFPEMHGTPNVHHSKICLAELMGEQIAMNGQIITPNGQYFGNNNKLDLVINQSPEYNAFLRWQDKEFLQIEKDYARDWRIQLSNLNLRKVFAATSSDETKIKDYKSLADIKCFADNFINNPKNKNENIKAVFESLNIPKQFHIPIMKRWHTFNSPSLKTYAPYTAHILTVNVFFKSALLANLISPDRPSNFIDIAYLYYLPFCKLFVSNDKLHQKCTPLFLRRDQEFIWGPELKKGLNEVNDTFINLPKETQEKGIMAFKYLPEESNILSNIWDRHSPSWRAKEENKESKTYHNHADTINRLAKYNYAKPLKENEIDLKNHDVESLSLNKTVRERKGSLYQVPKSQTKNTT
ncbi:MAG: hypothetical protein PF692_01580 [Kiritimatiellae bacterium]|jgi:hypothetical protein|nr:hypothetical protein [Kiritimatiellia bacterium]